MPYTVSSPEFARFRELARQANSDAPVFLTHYQAEQDLHSAVASILLLLASLSPRVFKNLCCVLLLPPRASCQGPSAGERLDCGRYRHLCVRLVCGGRRGPSDQRDHREPPTSTAGGAAGVIGGRWARRAARAGHARRRPCRRDLSPPSQLLLACCQVLTSAPLLVRALPQSLRRPRSTRPRAQPPRPA